MHNGFMEAEDITLFWASLKQQATTDQIKGEDSQYFFNTKRNELYKWPTVNQSIIKMIHFLTYICVCLTVYMCIKYMPDAHSQLWTTTYGLETEPRSSAQATRALKLTADPLRKCLLPLLKTLTIQSYLAKHSILFYK